MMTPRDKVRILTGRLALLELRPVAAEALARVCGGGETASTSTSGTPAAGDDTVGDSSGGGGGGAGKVQMQDFHFVMR